MHNGEDSSDSDESGKAVGNCEDLDFDDMMASIENFIEEDPEFINKLFGKKYYLIVALITVLGCYYNFLSLEFHGLELRVVKTANATGKIKSKNDNSTCMMPLNSFLACTYFYHCSLDKLVLLVSLYSKNSVIFVMNFGTLANHDVGAKIYS
jgi:hypothetical protein